jgi:hypothetical protein
MIEDKDKPMSIEEWGRIVEAIEALGFTVLDEERDGKWTDGGETEDDERSNGPTIN